ncbi:hypothetical protein RRF57_012121 [Xylaria bambusicola]|uniref:Uncharacterized protein n=1 Tax=Xylaria bambusicola TaxID=326684 RepID=A0AAN7V5B0_9PEZI
MRFWVSQLLKLVRIQAIKGVENNLTLHVFQLWDVFPDIIAVRIALPGLRYGIEHGVTRLPPLRVVARVPAHQVLREPPPTPVVVEEEVG